jgi:hypothetical protein
MHMQILSMTICLLSRVIGLFFGRVSVFALVAAEGFGSGLADLRKCFVLRRLMAWREDRL